MKRIKIYKNVLEEVDFIYEIVKMLDEPMPIDSYPYVQLELKEIEYEDENNIFHYASDICKRSLLALGFQKEETSDHIYIKGNYRIGFVYDYDTNTFVIQRQA